MRRHLRDEAEFIARSGDSRRRCRLKPVSFIKPIGAENEHPGYASEHTGSDHLVSPPGQGAKTPGPSDNMGPSTRIPALILAPGLKRDFSVDHTSHDTTSI